ncbi:hypothetical protein A9Q99_01265 [Gammaproteobacteria bacterium 45_16_T64]|nr:hypothetical protein A9Q99_01265 [Gammaproteobacteria bacterium 45_16_T64]
MNSRDKWNRIYQKRTESEETSLTLPTPCPLLAQYHYLLPAKGAALDLACGFGGNAIFLQKQGLSVEAWDISDIAIAQLRSKNIPNIACHDIDIEQHEFPSRKFDVIVVSNYLHRNICHNISQALTPGGLLFYQTFHQQKISTSGPSNPNFLLKNNELLSLFGELNPLIHSHLGSQGNLSLGERNLASLIAQKPT